VRVRWGAIAIAGGLLALASGGAGAAPSSCSARGSYTVAENGVARVYSDADDYTITCSKANGRRNVIADDSYDLIEDLKLRGHFVAFIRESCETSGFECAEGVYVVDVRRDDDELFFARGDGSTVVLRSNGSIAWSEHDLDPRYEDERENIAVIYRHTRRGTTRLDRGHLVEADSLRLTGSKLSWRNGGELRRATLR
jgi:hypothetical protein